MALSSHKRTMKIAATLRFKQRVYGYFAQESKRSEESLSDFKSGRWFRIRVSLRDSGACNFA
jgi:hypothetical protein